MLTYILRRLLIMVPTLLGVTVVSFFIMQLAPGDPLMYQLSGESAGKSNQSRDAYTLQKRELYLDKPLLLNFRYFKDYSEPVRWAAYYRGRTIDEIRADLPALADRADDPEVSGRLKFLRSLAMPEFNDRLEHQDRWDLLAKSIDYYAMVFCEDTGANGATAAIALLQDPKSDLKLRIGAILCLRKMVPNPFVFTYSVHPTAEETSAVVGAWQLWWDLHKKDYPEVDPEARQWLEKKLPAMTGDRKKLFAAIDEIVNSDYTEVAPRFFAVKLLNDATPLEEKFVASVYLKQLFSEPLKMDVSLDASAAQVDQAAKNWFEHYQIHRAEYEPGFGSKLWYVLADTQYSHMLARLTTFQFGQSAIKTHEPVSDMIWRAFVVSAPLMFMSELLIYIVAVPLGILCGVFRNGWTDRSISLGLFVLYSVPAFVAGMLFLVFFCYGDYLKWFPMLGLHSEESRTLPFWAYLMDYLWHAFLPVVCLSLFSLAAIAMYSRSSILDVINQDYIRTARAKGLPERTVVLKHALRNGLIPILTLFSTFLPTMLGGAVLIEVLFDIPGLGQLSWSSILQKDFPTLMALLYVEAIVTLVSFLITDVLYVLVDPRISFAGKGKAA